MKENLYIVIDKLHGKSDGGLVASYINLSELLKDDYNIKIISIFKHNCSDCFINNEKISIIDKDFDINFPNLLKNKKIFKAIRNAFIYFISIYSSRKKIKKLMTDDDLIIVSSPSAAIFMPKIKFILEIHTSYKYFFEGYGIGRIQSKLMQKPSSTIFRTKYDAEHAPKYLNPTYIYNFFDNKDIIRNDKLIKNKILFMGRLNDEKDPLRLLEIVTELKKSNKDFILDIYGNGDLEKKMHEKIAKRKLKNNVYLKGFTNDKNVYKDYSLLLLTSKVEGFGLVIIEAKANGIPTLSTNWGKGVYEVINDNKDGYIVNTNEEFVAMLLKIFYDEKLQKRLSNNAYNDFKRFNKETAKEKWTNILDNHKGE